MRVIFIMHSVNLYAGSTKVFMSLLDGLLTYDVKPLVILPQKNELMNILLSKGVSVVVLDYRMNIYPPRRYWKDYIMFLPRLSGRIYLNYIATKKICEIARRFRPDIIHTNVSVVDVGYKVAKQLHLPHLWHIREYADKIGMHHYPCLCAFLGRLRQHSFAICITKDIQKHFKLKESNSRVIYDGVLSEKYIRFDRAKEKYFLFAGRLEPIKGIEELLIAFAEFCKLRPDSGFKLKIAGDTTDVCYRNHLINELRRMQVEDKVEFLGMRKDVFDLMSKTYMMIVPSRSEGFGFVTAEAQFNGALVLGRDTDGTKEQFDNGLRLTGEDIALRYTTHQELIHAMCDVVDKGIEYYFSMIERSQKVVRELYSKEHSVRQIYDFYSWIQKNESALLR